MKSVLAAVAAAVGLAAVAGGVPTHAQESVRASDPTMAISLVHGIPDTVVDVRIGESVVINAFRPGSIADISAFAGRTLEDVNVIDDDTGDVLLGPIAELDVPIVGNWSLVVHLDTNGNAVLTPFENDVSAVPSGSSRLTFRHTAKTDAIDLLIGDERPVSNAVNGDSATLELPDGTLANAQVAPAGDAATVSISSLDLAADTNTVIYTIGTIAGDDLDFVVQVIALTESASAPTTSAASRAVTTTAPATTTTTTADTDTTSTTTADTDTTSTTAAGGSATTVQNPTGVATGSPLDDTRSSMLIVTVAGLVLAGGAVAARRRI